MKKWPQHVKLFLKTQNSVNILRYEILQLFLLKYNEQWWLIFFQSPLLHISTILHIVDILAKSVNEKIISINIEKDNFLSSVLMTKCNYWNISVSNSSFLEGSWWGIWKVENDNVGLKPSSVFQRSDWLKIAEQESSQSPFTWCQNYINTL